MKLRLLWTSFLLIGTLMAQSTPQQSCLVVRSGENHRVRNSIVYGALTGGVGLFGALVLSNTRYERVDSIGTVPFRAKYSGGELKEIATQGTHVVIIGKHDMVPAMGTACGYAAPVPMPVPAAITASVAKSAPHTPEDIHQPICVETMTNRTGNMTCLRWSNER